MYSVTVVGDKAVVARLGRMRKALPRMMGVALTAGAQPLVNRAKDLCPYKTGNLRRSIHFGDLIVGPGFAQGDAGSNLEYAAAQENGATIVPRTARMLHWVTDTGEDVFARQVTIPPHPYMRPAAAETLPLVAAATAHALALQIVRVP